MVKEVKDHEEFHALLKNAGQKLVVVDFHATWCGPCKTIAPRIEEMSKEYTDVIFLKVDVDELGETAEEFKVNAMPTFLLFKAGKVVETVVGASEQKIRAAVKANAS